MKREISWLGIVVVGIAILGACSASGGAGKAQASEGSISLTGSMSVARFDHAAALLPDGKVLIVGGLERNGVIEPTAELYDPATGNFSPAGKMQSPHGWGATATTLADGKVLVAGGATTCGAPCYVADAELYDPATHSFTATGRMTAARAGARSVRLPNGDVLLVGGSSDRVATAEVYHVATGKFSPAGETGIAEASPQVVALHDGRVLIIGSTRSVIYDPGAGRFTATGSLLTPRGKFGVALLPDGRVLVAGGQTGGAWGARVSSTEIYDPATGRFRAGPELTATRFKLSTAVVSLRDGRVLIGGGADYAEVYDPARQRFLRVGGSPMDGFLFSTATVLKDGRVLLAGGYPKPGGAGVSHAWLYQP
jgi:hypothetical protein